MELIMHISNVKSIKDITFSFPLEKGLYAITGENASGKSTLVACASSCARKASRRIFSPFPAVRSFDFGAARLRSG